MAKSTKPLALADAVSRLTPFGRAAPSDRAGWKALDAVLSRLPEGVPLELLTNALAHASSGYHLHTLQGLPAFADDAVIAALELHAEEPRAAFVLAGLRVTKKERHGALQELLWPGLDWAKGKQNDLARLRQLVKRADFLVGAQAAVALTDPEEYVTSEFLPLLAVDGSEDSLDVLMPFVQQAVKEKGSELDWLRRALVPLLAKTPATRALLAVLDDAVEVRTERSAAKVFCAALGMQPVPAVLQAEVSVRCNGPNPGKPLYQVKFDSTKARWCSVRGGWWRTRRQNGRLVETKGGLHVWYPVEDPLAWAKQELAGKVARYTLQVKSKAVDREKLSAWLDGLVATGRS